ncbi:MAG: CDP-diacylglycerol--glycerol-3-phosphate 3-phosphatidyltransferase [Myxococcaceae bacterium]|nr:CDP-diacylglycerol--glycerol-3-phosphate 3-phosphatidyltransferase [Myxococcaceae bacterium]
MVPRWLPNAISMLRIALVPLWVGLAFDARARTMAGREVDVLPVMLVLILLGASDVIDGTIARHFQLTSNLGATLDAVADKLAQVTMVTWLAWFAWPVFTPLPVWLWGALLLRDLLLSTGWVTVWRRRGAVEVEHRWHGKAASLLLFALVLAATARAPELPILVGSAVVVAIMILGTAAYLREGWRQLKG